MVPGLAETLRERFTIRHLLPHAAFLALAYGITRSTDILIALTIALVLGETVETLRETPAIDNRWVQSGIGVFVTVGSLTWLAYELTIAANTGGPAWFPALMILAGLWFLLDARKDFAEGKSSYPSDTMDTSEMMLVMNHGHLVVEELKEGSKTVTELAERCDLTESRVREALDVATDDGMVYPVSEDSRDDTERYALDESKVGGVAFIRSNGKRIIRRLTRPLRS